MADFTTRGEKAIPRGWRKWVNKRAFIERLFAKPAGMWAALKAIGAYGIFGLVYLSLLATAALLLAYISSTWFTGAETIGYLLWMFVFPIVLVLGLFVAIPALVSERHRRAQDIAILLAGLIVLQSVLELNLKRSIQLREDIEGFVASTVAETRNWRTRPICLDGLNSVRCEIMDLFVLGESTGDWPRLFFAKKEDVARLLGVAPDLSRIKARLDEIDGQLTAIEAPLPRTTAGGRVQRRFIQSDIIDNELIANKVYRELREERLALNLLATMFLRDQVEASVAFWASPGKFTATVNWLLGIRTAEFWKMFYPFFFSVAFGVFLARIALKPPERQTAPGEGMPDI